MTVLCCGAVISLCDCVGLLCGAVMSLCDCVVLLCGAAEEGAMTNDKTRKKAKRFSYPYIQFC